MKRGKVALWVALACAGTYRSHADIIGVNWEAGEGVDQNLGLSDGSWDLDQDWFYALVDKGSAATIAFETWLSDGPVEFQIDAYGNGLQSGVLHVTKTIGNATDDVWEGFQIDVAPLPPIDWVQVVPESVHSNQFQDSIVVNHPDGTSSITLLPDEEGGMYPGEGDVITFDLMVPPALYTPFSMTQYPIPEPATAALLSLGLFVLSRSRARRSQT